MFNAICISQQEAFRFPNTVFPAVLRDGCFPLAVTTRRLVCWWNDRIHSIFRIDPLCSYCRIANLFDDVNSFGYSLGQQRVVFHHCHFRHTGGCEIVADTRIHEGEEEPRWCGVLQHQLRMYTIHWIKRSSLLDLFSLIVPSNCTDRCVITWLDFYCRMASYVWSERAACWYGTYLMNIQLHVIDVNKKCKLSCSMGTQLWCGHVTMDTHALQNFC